GDADEDDLIARRERWSRTGRQRYGKRQHQGMDSPKACPCNERNGPRRRRHRLLTAEPSPDVPNDVRGRPHVDGTHDDDANGDDDGSAKQKHDGGVIQRAAHAGESSDYERGHIWDRETQRDRPEPSRDGNEREDELDISHLGDFPDSACVACPAARGAGLDAISAQHRRRRTRADEKRGAGADAVPKALSYSKSLGTLTW